MPVTPPTKVRTKSGASDGASGHHEVRIFQSNSIGVSSHKNEYKAGVRVGNWVEELAGREAELAPPEAKDTLKAFMSHMEEVFRVRCFFSFPRTCDRSDERAPKNAADPARTRAWQYPHAAAVIVLIVRLFGAAAGCASPHEACPAEACGGPERAHGGEDDHGDADAK